MKTFSLEITITVKHYAVIEIESETITQACIDARSVCNQITDDTCRATLRGMLRPPVSMEHHFSPAISVLSEVTKAQALDP